MTPLSSIQTSTATSSAHSGATMDRKVEKAKPWYKAWYLIIIIVAAVIFGGYQLMIFESKSLSVDGLRLSVATVEKGTFEDFIPVRGRVIPSRTLYLDAIEGGRVERILVEDGAQLEAGDLIVELSNASLQLSVLSNEAQVAEQLNNIRSIELSLEQNRLQHKRDLIDIEYQIKLLTRKLEREAPLLASNSISQSQYDDTADSLLWYQQRLALTKESQASDARMQESQLAFLKSTGERLEHNLAISRKNLDNMNVRAPVAGKLSGFDVEVGQSIGRGERLGQIDTPDDFKVSVLVDEFYLPRIDLGQQAVFEDYLLTITKIYPQVQNGQFEIDLTFERAQPPAIRRGQTLQMKLTLGDASEAIFIPNSAFYQDTGGNWVFVVSNDGTQATRRNVRLGRRNNNAIEIVEGLSPGERVIISSYADYLDMQVLYIDQK